MYIILTLLFLFTISNSLSQRLGFDLLFQILYIDILNKAYQGEQPQQKQQQQGRQGNNLQLLLVLINAMSMLLLLYSLMLCYFLYIPLMVPCAMN